MDSFGMLFHLSTPLRGVAMHSSPTVPILLLTIHHLQRTNITTSTSITKRMLPKEEWTRRFTDLCGTLFHHLIPLRGVAMHLSLTDPILPLMTHRSLSRSTTTI